MTSTHSRTDAHGVRRGRSTTHGMRRDRSTTAAVTMYAALAAVALVLSYVESLIPLPLPAGIKLGFANIAVIVALYMIGGRGAFAVNLVRILLAGLMFTGASAMLYALCGGIAGVTVMILLRRAGIFGVVGVSVGGSAAHITGQICLASLVIHNGAIFMSLPFFLISSTVSGVMVGFIAYLLLRSLRKALRYG